MRVVAAAGFRMQFFRQIFFSAGSKNHRIFGIIGLLAVLWLVTVLISVSKLSAAGGGAGSGAQSAAQMDVINDNLERLNQAIIYVDESKRRIEGLQAVMNEHIAQLEDANQQDREKILVDIETKLMDSIKEDNLSNNIQNKNLVGSGTSNSIPSSEYEQLRRRVNNNIKEFWYYAQSEIKKMAKKEANKDSQVNDILSLLAEHKNNLHPDATENFRSLDDIYYYGGQNPHNRQAIIPHKPRSHQEIHLRPGDMVGIAGNHWDGFSKGKNENTNQNGLFPSFKVVDKVEVADFPNYSHVK